MAKAKVPVKQLQDDEGVDECLRPVASTRKEAKKTASASSPWVFEPVDKELLITASLLDQIDFHTGCKIGSPWKESSRKDLQGMLARAPWSGDSKFTKRGMAFEQKLCTFANCLSKDKFYGMMEPDCLCDVEKLGEMYDKIKGSKQQQTLKESIVINGQRFFMYGKADVLFPGTSIKDIKTTSSWKPDDRWPPEDKYRKKSQHLMYSIMGKIPDFEYLVAEFVESNDLDAEGNKIWKLIDVHCFDSSTPDLAAGREKLYQKITDNINFIAGDPEMWANYINVFTRSW